MLSRAHFLRIFFSLTILPILLGCQSRDERKTNPVVQNPDQRFNVLIIVSDALRYDLLGCDGGPAHTPNIDHLAARGTLFHQAYSAAPWTTPAAISLITGRHPSVFLTKSDSKVVYGGGTYQVPASLVTLPNILKKSGYSLALNSHNPNSWIAGNFDSFARVEVVAPGSALRNADPKLVALLPRIMNFDRQAMAHRYLVGMFDFLNNHPAGKPFFALNWINDPHTPYHPEGKFLASVKVPQEGLTRDQDFYLSQLKMRIFDHFNQASLTPQEIQYFKDLYRAEVESMDERVGLLIRMLEYRHQLAKTIIVFTADHGEEFQDHDGFGHGRSYYQELLHVPLIMSGPGIPTGLEVEQVVTTTDLMATLKGLLGLSQWRPEQGSGFMAAMRGEELTHQPLFFDSAIHFDTNNCRDAVLDGRFKLITHTGQTASELYDLATDPGESHNLALAQPGDVDRLAKYLAKFRRDCLDEKSAMVEILGTENDTSSSQEKAEILKKLKSLGYVN